MTIDTSIPLAAYAPTPQQQASAALMQQQLHERQQAAASQNALRNLFAQPGAIGPNGMPTQNALGRAMQIDPHDAMRMQSDALSMKLAQAGLSEKQWKAGVEAASGAKDVYDQLLEQGASPVQARQQAQANYAQGIKRLAASGLLSPDQIAQMNPTFDPQRVASSQQMLRYREMKREADARIGMEGARLGMERQFHNDELGLQRDRLKWEIESGRGDKQQVLMDPAHKDAAGNPTPYIYDMTKHKAYTLTGDPYTPGGAVKMANSAQAGMLSDDAANRMADQAIAGDKSALTGLGYGNAGAANRAKVQEAITRKLKAAGLTGADLAAKTAEFTGLVSGERALGSRSANLGMAANEAQSFAPMVLATSDALDRTEFPTLNALENAAAKGAGGEKVVRFVDALNAFQNAYAQVVTRGGQSTDAARQQAKEILEKNWSKGQIRAGVDQLMQEIQIAKDAPGATQDELRGMFRHAQGDGQPAMAAPKDAQGAEKHAEKSAEKPVPSSEAAHPPKPQGADDQLRAWAKDSIAAGAPRGKVIERLKAWGVPTDGI